METAYARFDARQDRPRFLSRLYGRYLEGSVLDVGCDKAVLREFVGAERYTGIDRSPEADLNHDLMADGRLPFEDGSFDTVVCTDVLEHLENLHQIFDELVRVARRHLLITLPNNWNSARQRLRRGKGAIAHYGLPLEPPPDRHRWFFSLGEAEEFFRGQLGRFPELSVAELCALEKPRPSLVRAARRLAHPEQGRYLNLFAHTLVCVYEKRAPAEA